MKLSIVRCVPWWFGPQTRVKIASRPSARDAPGLDEEAEQQIELGRRHLHRGPGSQHGPRGGVHPHVPELVERPWLLDGPRTAPQRRTDPREQLGEAERLGDVILRAELEPRHLVHLTGPRAEHDDRHRHPFAAHRLPAPGTH